MTALQMSISAAILIITIVLIRSVAADKLPRKTYLVLWGIVLIRLAVPVAIPLPFNISPLFTAAERTEERTAETPTVTPDVINTVPAYRPIFNTPDFDGLNIGAPAAAPAPAPENIVQIPPEVTPEISPEASPQNFPLIPIWIAGMTGLALFFLVTHFYRRKEYSAAFPVENDYINEWLKSHKLKRTVKVLYTDRINTPMTYGVFKPVILFPQNTDWLDTERLRYILAHELTHIKRFDILLKWLLAAALCVHWFNPAVWLMYILANRDMEIACDEKVVWTFGAESKSAYALALIGMEESRSGFSLHSNFAKIAIKERIVAIMKLKKRPVIGTLLAIALVAVLTAGTLFVYAQTNGNGEDGYCPEYAFSESTEAIETETPIQLCNRSIYHLWFDSYYELVDYLEYLRNPEATAPETLPRFRGYNRGDLWFDCFYEWEVYVDENSLYAKPTDLETDPEIPMYNRHPYLWFDCYYEFLEHHLEYSRNNFEYFLELLLSKNITNFSVVSLTANNFIASVSCSHSNQSAFYIRVPTGGPDSTRCAWGYLYSIFFCIDCLAIVNSIRIPNSRWNDGHDDFDAGWTVIGTDTFIRHGNVHPGTCHLITRTTERCRRCFHPRFHDSAPHSPFWCPDPNIVFICEDEDEY